jgi:hypothetical protein
MKMIGKIEAESYQLKEIPRDIREYRMNKNNCRWPKLKDYTRKSESLRICIKLRLPKYKIKTKN